MVASKINTGETVDPKDRVVVIPFPAPVKAGETLRLRIAETYTAPVSYRLDGDELVFDRSLGRPRNAVGVAEWMVLHGEFRAGYGECAGGWASEAGLLGRSAGGGGCFAEGEAAGESTMRAIRLAVVFSAMTLCLTASSQEASKQAVPQVTWRFDDIASLGGHATKVVGPSASGFDADGEGDCVQWRGGCFVCRGCIRWRGLRRGPGR
ncbi:MAG: hypothetical protein WDN23_00240 [Edaphobacter sp.]